MVITIEPGVYVPGQVGCAHRRHGRGHGTRVRSFDTHQQGTCRDLKRTSSPGHREMLRQLVVPFRRAHKKAEVGPTADITHKMNQKELKELIEFLIEKDIAEFELERGDVKVRIKRGSEPVASASAPDARFFTVHAAPPPAPELRRASGAAGPRLRLRLHPRKNRRRLKRDCTSCAPRSWAPSTSRLRPDLRRL